MKWLISYENMEIMVLLNLMENIELLIFVSEGPPQNNYGLNSSGARKADLNLSDITYRYIVPSSTCIYIHVKLGTMHL